MKIELTKVRVQVRRGLLLSALMVAIVAGCATQQAKQITNLPQAPGLAGLPDKTPLPQLPPPAARDAGAAPTDAESIQRIEAYIAAHPDQKATIASLRIRQGVLYLNQKQYNLAAAAFDSADATLLVTDRDQALKAISPELVWWFRTAPLPNIPAAEMGRAESAMRVLKVETAKRQGSPDTRELLAETRAWIGLKYFAALADRGKQKVVMEDTINEYATIFTPADLAYLCAPGRVSDGVPLEEQRRRLRAGPVIKQARDYASELTGTSRPTFRDPVMQDLIAPTANPQCKGS
jgi:hypothetical protein